MKSFPLVLIGTLALVGCGGPLESEDVFEDEAQEEMLEEGEIGEAAAIEGDDTFELGVASGSDSDDLVAWCNDVLTWDSTATTWENKVLELVNQRRAAGATCGGVAKPKVAALTFDERLRCAARKHSKDMGDKNFFSHTGSNGSSPWQRINNAGYSYTAAAENIAAGQNTPESVVDGWMKSTGHCNNIMAGNLKHLGVGYYYKSTATYKHYWTQDFGSQ
ncbi:CAP domain-containing protein [Polyangium aurulentum]|uniref:CAP domain-containing protein n=1 Tax=Polyangium aurulentum TaxID=2567896 RepID=UPI001F42A7E7|nr:CAP domain-containing protein [Polyangium aurulentum]